MTINLQAVEVRHETRLRLVFTNTLGSGAFGIPAPTLYSLTNEDGRGSNPVVQAAFVVSGSPNVVELSFAPGLVRGALYTLRADGVPAGDASTTPINSVLSIRWGLSSPKKNVEPVLRNRHRLLYFVDLLWNGDDYQESALGDLDQVEGPANVTKALNRGAESGPVPWDETYGAGAREFIDSPSAAAGNLKGNIAKQLQRDPRVRSSKVTHEIQDEVTFIYGDAVLLGGEPIERVSIEVPNDS